MLEGAKEIFNGIPTYARKAALLETDWKDCNSCNSIPESCSEVQICMHCLIRIEYGFGNPSFVSIWVEQLHISRDSKKDGVKVRFGLRVPSIDMT